MLGKKQRKFLPQVVSLETLVPQDNFYRKLEAAVNLSFVRDLTQDFYATNMGRPSIDPVVFFKLQLIMLFEGIRSERQLLEMVQLNLAFRWYIGYDFDEEIPDHSSLTKIRERYGLPIFRKFFEHIVEMCIAAGLVWGKELYFDGTRVEANAAMDSNVSNFEYELHNHLNVLFPDQEPVTLSRPEPDFIENWVTRYQEPSAWEEVPSAYQSLAKQRTSLTDPDATPLRMTGFSGAKLGYHTHYAVDGGGDRIILGVLVTPASVQDNQPMLDMERWVRFRWQISPDSVTGDSKYGTIDNIVGLHTDGIQPFLARTDYNKGKKFYSNEMFCYDPENDVYYCPQNQILKRQGIFNVNRSIAYRAGTKSCRNCPVREKCTTSKRGRTIHRSMVQDVLDWAAILRETKAYAKAMRKRQVWVEPLFGEGKQWHGLSRFRLRRLWRVNIEAFLIASVQNIKRLLKPRYSGKNKPDPAQAIALQVPQPMIQIALLLFIPTIVNKATWPETTFSTGWDVLCSILCDGLGWLRNTSAV